MSPPWHATRASCPGRCAPSSGLDWTVIRPPQLTGKPLTGTYQTVYGQNIRDGLAVPRADAAHLMLRVVGQPETIHQAIGIAS